MMDEFDLPALRPPTKTTGPFPLDGQDVSTLSRAQIKQALGKGATVYHNCSTRIARIHEDVIVKYGADVNIWEANNMKYVKEHTTIRLPKVIDAWEEIDDEQTICYIVMDYIEGELLSEIWSELTEETRYDINCQLSDFVHQLQSLKMDSPGPIGGGISNGAFFTDYGAGPFESKDAIEAYFNERLLVCQDFGIATTQPPFHGQFEHLVMCHMDLHIRNIILDDEGKIWLIDWTFAGMYPPYFEMAVLVRQGWAQYFQDALRLLKYEQYNEEIARLIAIGFAFTTGALCKPRGLN
ncbi:phosphotransferase enzyme family protein [Xylona heveae TC161]|uniref:Phosphotransferase enzyme family protein n=1 Tax=Xylona heveae (strain CBS 132557 / TC161) TaxID=1328760 RepID=A0A165IIK7_XYLHT|nr:phosphotransferase enzyme family protein [Xylona heveae TC161]KZF24945.1 phosphotransferase enzyme family protein [Xylona heveae TC161]